MVSDQELVQAMAKGDQAAFEAFVHRYHGPLQRYLVRLLKDERKAEDLVQETFVRLLKQLKQKQIPDHIKAWMYRVATNLSRDYWKSASYRKEKQQIEELPEKEDQKASVIEIYERLETRQEVLQSLNKLSDQQREIVILRFYQDLQLKEIAATLEIPIGTVKSKLFHALRKLKESMALKELRRSERKGEIGEREYARPRT